MIDEIVWREGELLTQEFLEKNGYKILLTNYSRLGVELDIVSIYSKKAQSKKLKKELKQKIKDIKPKYKKGFNQDSEQKTNKNLVKNKQYKQELNKQIVSLKNRYKSLLSNLDNIIAVTEVKARSSDKYGSGADAISEQKKGHIKKATNYLVKELDLSDFQIRFDIASVDDGKVNYIEDVF